MTTFTLSNPTRPATGVPALIKRHPLMAYFALAFAGTWLTFLPVWASTRGLGLLPFDVPEVAAILLFILATFTGPTLAAYIVTAVESGTAGVKQFVRRYGQWRVGWQWYALLLLGYPLLFAVGISLGGRSASPFVNLVTQWPVFFSVYLPAVLAGLLIPALGEEPGWRGFALTRLQQSHGPLVGTLILGGLHALWHLPAYFVSGLMTQGGFDLTVFASNSLTIVASTVLWTWLFNKSRGSIFFAMLIHSVSNASGSYLMRIMPDLNVNFWVFASVFVGCAVGLIIATRGRLAYRPANTD